MNRIKDIRPDEALAVLVFGMAVITSTWTWFDLARSASFPETIAWVPSISLDLGGLYYARNWIKGHTAALRTWGRATTIIAFLVSLAGNAVQHAIESGFLVVNIWIVLGVGAVPVLALFGVSHQWSLTGVRPGKPVRRGGYAEKIAQKPPAAKEVSVTKPTEQRTAEQVAAARDRHPASRGKRAQALEYARDNWPVKAAEIRLHMASRGGISMTEATRVRDRVAAEREAS